MKAGMLGSLVCVVALAFIAPILVAADAGKGKDEEQLKKIEQDWADAYVKRDPAVVQRIVADDFSFVGPDGSTVTHDEYIKSITGDMTFSSFKIEALNIRVYGDAAVVNGLTTISAQTKGEDESGQYSFTDVFVKQKGEWKAVSGHVTPVAKDQATE